MPSHETDVRGCYMCGARGRCDIFRHMSRIFETEPLGIPQDTRRHITALMGDTCTREEKSIPDA